jgi:hypothetical protein
LGLVKVAIEEKPRDPSNIAVPYLELWNCQSGRVCAVAEGTRFDRKPKTDQSTGA